MNDELLFRKYELSAVFENQRQKTTAAIDAFAPNRLLSTPADDLIEHFFQEYKIESVKIHEDQISVDQSEAKIDVSQDQMRLIYDRSRPFYLDGTRITFFVPYEGDKELYYCRPSTFNFNPPER